jgi:hypothetical protein
MVRMAWSNQTARKQDIRAASSKFLSSKLKAHLEISPGERLAGGFLPYKCLPVVGIDTELEDAIVILKGTILSLVTNKTSLAYSMQDVSDNGTIPVFLDKTNSNAVVTANIDSSYWGYEDAIAGLIVPANGGVASERFYSADDVTVGTFSTSGTLMTTTQVGQSAKCTIPANMPVGVAYTDIYQDIRGRNLNYQIWGPWGVLCDYYIEVPYVDMNSQSYFASGLLTAADTQIDDLNTTTCAGYLATYKKYPFMYFTSASNGGDAGQIVKSDLHGKFVPVNTNTTGNATVQAIGRIILTDSRWPKDMQELVDTYPGSGMPGTETGGIPYQLYNFAKDVLEAIASASVSIATIVAAIQAGKFGMAKIQLNI